MRVLQIVTQMHRAGLETMLMNYYRQIDREKVQFDFLVHRPETDYEPEIRALGGSIFRVPPLNPFSRNYLKALDAFFQNHSYRVVHAHLDCTSAIPLYFARRHGVPVRIAHSHNTDLERDFRLPVKLVLKRLIPLVATRYMACSPEAGRWLFGHRPVTVLKNAIDAAAYRYDAETAARKKASLGLKDAFLIGHVGRICPQKNQLFLLDIFQAVLQEEPRARLLLIGEGDDATYIHAVHEKVSYLGLKEKVIFLGVRDDVPQLLQALDIFLFPSRFEGLGIAAVEAQAAGLPALLSDTIPRDCFISDTVQAVPLTAPAVEWARQVFALRGLPRQDQTAAIVRADYDITANAEKLTRYYWKAGGGE